MEEKNSIFTKPWKPIGKAQFALTNFLNSVLGIVLWLLDFVFSMVSSVLLFLRDVCIYIYKAILVIGKFFQRKGHQFKYNNKEGRLSYILWGFSNFKNRQIVNGFMYIIFEVAYIVLFFVFGVGCIGKLSLTNQKIPGPDPSCTDMFCPTLPGDNSVMNLILGLLWILSLLIFIYIWNRSINAGYTNYRIKEYTRYETIYNGMKERAAVVDEEVRFAFNEGLSKSNYLKRFYQDIDVYIDKSLPNESRDYLEYLYRGIIDGAYLYGVKIVKAERLIELRQKKLDDYKVKSQIKLNELEQQKAVFDNKNIAELSENASEEEQIAYENNKFEAEQTKLSEAEKFQVKYDKYKNKVSMKIGDLEQRVTKAKHKQNEVKKTYANFVEIQSKKNSDKYGKFNVYYKTIADYDKQLLFYNHVEELLKIYKNASGGADKANSDNQQKAVELKQIFDKKNVATEEKFAGIRAKRTDLESQIAELKTQYNESVELIKQAGEPDAEDKLIEAKNELVASSTRLINALNDLPSKKMVKSLYKEELNESKHAYNRDRKYLKTNYTEETYCKQQVIDHMMLEYRFEYADARYFTEVLLNDLGELAVEKAALKITQLESEKKEYELKHQDKFVGKPKSFKEQIKSLLDEKFHITILALPVLGIVLMTILPLIFSILIAFTNYSKGHIPPTQIFTWVGFENFINVFAPPEGSMYSFLPEALGSTLLWTLLWAVCATFTNYILGIVVALMINKQSIKLKKLWRTVFVMTIAIPQFISLLTIYNLLKPSGVIDQLWLQMTGSRLGFATNGNVAGTKLIIILVNIWIGIPYTILSTTGILLNIPKDLYESSTVDGAGTFKQFTKITMPYILFVTGPYLLTQFVGNINNFNVIYFLTGGEPKLVGSALNVGQTDLLITFLYKLITDGSNPQYGIASTLGILIFAICAFFSIVMYNKTGSIKEEDTFQ